MLKNYFAQTLRFNPHELEDKENLVISDIKGLREIRGKKVITYLYHNVEFVIEYRVETNEFRAMSNNYPHIHDLRISETQRMYDTLTEVVEYAATAYEKETFQDGLRWLVTSVFKNPYKYRSVKVVEQYPEKQIAKVLIDGHIKAVFAYRFREEMPFVLRIALGHARTLKHPDLWSLGRDLRKLVSSYYR